MKFIVNTKQLTSGVGMQISNQLLFITVVSAVLSCLNANFFFTIFIFELSRMQTQKVQSKVKIVFALIKLKREKYHCEKEFFIHLKALLFFFSHIVSHYLSHDFFLSFFCIQSIKLQFVNDQSNFIIRFIQKSCLCKWFKVFFILPKVDKCNRVIYASRISTIGFYCH